MASAFEFEFQTYFVWKIRVTCDSQGIKYGNVKVLK
jgi:hypothetical protein